MLERNLFAETLEFTAIRMGLNNGEIITSPLLALTYNLGDLGSLAAAS